MKSMNVESLYVAPEVEVLEVAVEAGFAGSGEDSNDPTIDDSTGFPF